MTPGLAIGVRALVGAAAGLAATAPLAWLGERLVRRRVPRVALAGVLTGAAAVSATLVEGGVWLTALGVGLALVLGLLVVVDAVSLRLPDALTLPLGVAGLLSPTLGAGPDVSARLIGAAVGFVSLALVALAFRRATGRAGLGLGDAKLFAAAGAWLGWTQLPQVLIVTCGVGLAWAGLRVLGGGVASLRRPIPFGGGLCAGLLCLWLLASRSGG